MNGHLVVRATGRYDNFALVIESPDPPVAASMQYFLNKAKALIEECCPLPAQDRPSPVQ